ncbi:MAG: Gfo/Idh/MocA family oxidoreductase [Chloroflexi bacterium]|nr:Gfo/Idh/MocA family oxidoreductase [Chloroflexota bacterium]
MANRIHVGVIGVGFGTSVQIPGFQAHPDTEVVAVCSARPERAQEAAERFGIAQAFSDYRQLLKLADLEAVSIVTPPAYHHAMSLDALAAGKHVLCEKPMARSLQEAREMTEAAGRSGHVGMLDHEFRFFPARTRMHELIQEGYLGDLHLLHVYAIGGFRADPARPWNWWSSRAEAGGHLGALGSHHIDATRRWFGEIASVLCQLDTVVKQRPLPGAGEMRAVDADDGFTLLMRLASGARVSIVATSAAHAPAGNRFEAYGTRGTLVIDRQERLWGAPAGASALEEIPIPPGALSRFGDYPQNSPVGAFIQLVDIFVQGIRGGTALAPSFADGLSVQETMEAAHRSHVERRWVDLPLA